MTKPRSGHFSSIPAAAVFDHRLSHADVRMLAALGAHADKNGRCWPATTTLANETSMSERHARTSLRNLENIGYVVTESRPGQSSMYWIPRNHTAGVPRNSAAGVEPNPGTILPEPRNHTAGDPGTVVPPNNTKNNSKNNYTFAGKIIRLVQSDYDNWAKAYPLIDLGAQLQALDDYYDNHLTGGDRNKWFARCSQALAKKNERARAGQSQQREEPKFNDGVY